MRGRRHPGGATLFQGPDKQIEFTVAGECALRADALAFIALAAVRAEAGGLIAAKQNLRKRTYAFRAILQSAEGVLSHRLLRGNRHPLPVTGMIQAGAVAGLAIDVNGRGGHVSGNPFGAVHPRFQNAGVDTNAAATAGLQQLAKDIAPGVLTPRVAGLVLNR